MNMDTDMNRYILHAVMWCMYNKCTRIICVCVPYSMSLWVGVEHTAYHENGKVSQVITAAGDRADRVGIV